MLQNLQETRLGDEDGTIFTHQEHVELVLKEERQERARDALATKIADHVVAEMKK